jgi:aspartyl protease family protein
MKFLSGCLLLLFMQLFIQSCFAFDIEAKMLAKGSAVLIIDGKQTMLREGARSKEGVLLVSADGKQAVIEVEGKKQKLTLSRRISTQFAQTARAEVTIPSGQGGHFFTMGLINGMPVQFLVDTGATSIAMNAQEAQRLGLDYRAGASIMMNTANGQAQGFVVVLPKVSVGNIELHQVDAIVSAGDSPTIILLGNSYLGRLDMSVNSGLLTLKEKFPSGAAPKK